MSAKGGGQRGRRKIAERHRIFAGAVAEGKDHTEAAQIAGVQSQRSARQRGLEWSRRPDVMQLVEQKRRQAGITEERVLRETAAVAFSSVEHYMIGDDGRLQLASGAPENAMQAVSSVKYRTVTTGTGDAARTTYEVEFKLWDKPALLKLAGRHKDVHGFADKVEVSGPNGGPVEVVSRVERVIVDSPNGAAR